MSDYKMNITGTIGLSEYSNIYDYLNIVDKNDKFTITIDKNNSRDVNIISSMLKDSNFLIAEEGYNETGDYFINAYKYE
ncbi:MAG: hypothetical protein ACRC2K_12205 [Clostridium sp.]